MNRTIFSFLHICTTKSTQKKPLWIFVSYFESGNLSKLLKRWDYWDKSAEAINPQSKAIDAKFAKTRENSENYFEIQKISRFVTNFCCLTWSISELIQVICCLLNVWWLIMCWLYKSFESRKCIINSSGFVANFGSARRWSQGQAGWVNLKRIM